MGIRAVRTQDQDVMSSVMRRFLINRVSPLVSLDRKSNPVAGSTDGRKLNRLLEKFGIRVREWLTSLSDGEISISDFHSKTVRILDEIYKDENADGGFLRELDKIVHDIRIEMDSTAANVRRLMNMNGSPRPLGTELTPVDTALLNLIEAAKAQIAGANGQNEKIATSPPAERPKSLRTIRNSDGKPIKDHPEYREMLIKFLVSRDITDSRCPQMAALYALLATLPLGKSLSKTEITARLEIKDGAASALINRLKEKRLYLNRRETPTNPGWFIQVMGRECKKGPESSMGHYCYGLVAAIA